MRNVPCTIVLALVLGVGLGAKAAEHLSASQVTWHQHFGHPTADTSKLFSLLDGHFRPGSSNVQDVVDTWLKEHPKAIVISVSTGRLHSPRFAYVWVVQGGDSLNVELVRRGCFGVETQILSPDEKPDVSQKDYEIFLQRVTAAGESAKAEKVGIWAPRQQNPVSVAFLGFTNRVLDPEVPGLDVVRPSSVFQVTNHSDVHVTCQITVDAFRPDSNESEVHISQPSILSSGAAEVIFIPVFERSNGWRYAVVVDVVDSWPKRDFAPVTNQWTIP